MKQRELFETMWNVIVFTFQLAVALKYISLLELTQKVYTGRATQKMVVQSAKRYDDD